MNARPLVPPAPKVHEKPLPGWRQIIEFPRNSIGTYTEHSFNLMINQRRIFGIETWLINDPDGIRHIFGPGVANYRKPIPMRRIFRPIAGDGVLLAEGNVWRNQRRVLAPVFTPNQVELLLPHFVEAAAGLVRRLENSTTANLAEEYQSATLDAVLRALFSLPSSPQKAELSALVRKFLRGPGQPKTLDAFAPTEDAFSFATGKRRRFKIEWNAAIDNLVAARRSAPRPQTNADMLDLLIAARDPESQSALADTEIRDQSATMIVAGHETTSRLLFWASYLLTLDPAEQERLRAEVQAFPPEKLSKLDDLQHWPRLRNVLYEALRLYPPAPNMVREAIDKDVVLGETISAGAHVWVSPWIIHRHRRFWDQPTAFIPDRFGGKPSPWIGGTFFPFGAGSRICIGATFAIAEAQIMLAALLSRFSIALASGQRPVMPVATALLAPNYEPRFTIEPLSASIA